MWWWLATAQARPMVLETTAGARVEVLPRSREEAIELAVYDNRAYLRRQVASWRDPSMWSASLDDVGGGVEFVVLHLREPGLVPTVVETAPHVFTVTLVPGTVELLPLAPVPTVAELLADPPRRPAPTPDRALLPLLRDGRSYGLDPTTIRLGIPEPSLPDQHLDVLGEPGAPSWAEIEGLRARLRHVEDPEVLAEVYRRLGDAFAGLRMPREAIHYYGRAKALGATSPSVLLARADAAFRIRDWKTARASCAEAAEVGAPEEEVLLCLAVLSQATLHPAPAPTGRALAAVASRRTSRFLAGDLLLRDGYADEAWPLLDAAADELRGEAREVAWLAAGDAALLRGDPELARDAYHRARHGRLDALLTLREDLVAMSLDGARGWSAWVPELMAHAESGGMAAPDAWWVLAQVHRRYGDPGSEAEALAALWDLHPRGRKAADVGERLLTACADRVGILARDGRDAELVDVWARCWRTDLLPYVDDASLLGPVADAWRNLGFDARALAVHQLLAESLALQGLEDFDGLAHLAELQLPTEPEHALDTVRYSRRFATTRAERSRLALAEAAALAATGDAAGARAAWASVQAPPEAARAARRAAALFALDQGDCAAAQRDLGEAVRAAPLEGTAGGDVELRLAQCAVTTGDDARALSLAALALHRSTDALVQGEAKWLATAIGLRTSLPVPDELRSDAGSFALVRAENERHRAFEARTDAWSHAQ